MASETLEWVWYEKEEIDEFAEEVYRELQVPLATSYVPLSLEELKEINRNLY